MKIATVLLIGASALVIAGCSVFQQAPVPQPTPKPTAPMVEPSMPPHQPPPPSGVVLGAYAQDGLAAFIASIGRAPSVNLHYDQWTSFPNLKNADSDCAQHIAPLMTWHPTLSPTTAARAVDILAHKFDAQLRVQAAAAKTIPCPFILRWFPEMEFPKPQSNYFYGYDPQTNWTGAGAQYVAVWNYIHAIFDSVGVTNARWAWVPGGKTYQKQWQAFFPGVAKVNFIGLDHYNGTDFGSDLDIQAFYRATSALGPPLILAETASCVGSAQTSYTMTMHDTAAIDYPAIHVIVWWAGMGKTCDYRLNGQGLVNYKAIAADPYFQAKLQ